MPNGTPDNTHRLDKDGASIVLDFERTSDTEGILTWEIPSSKLYDGILITGSLKEINPSNYPTDSVKYNPSPDFAVPADKIGNAQVVGAFYRDKTTITMTVIGLDADEVYFFSAHLVTNVRTYYKRGVTSYPSSTSSETFAGEMERSYGPPDNPVVGQVYYDEDQKYTFFWDGTTWSLTTSHTTRTGDLDPEASTKPEEFPKLGDFFYNTRLRILKSWNGTGWINAESIGGKPMTSTVNVGTSPKNAGRLKLIHDLKTIMGYPKVCVELDENHFNLAIDNALGNIRRYSDAAYSKRYFFMGISEFQDVYYLNDIHTGTNNIVDVLKIHRLNMMGMNNFAPDNIFAQQFMNQFYAPGMTADLVSVHLISAMSELYQVMFAADIAFNWNEASRELRIYKKFYAPTKVLVESACEKLDEELLNDRWLQQWLQLWAKSELYYILGNIRGKFSTLPGPGGGLQLNADTLISQAQQFQDEAKRQINDMEVGQQGPDNWHSPIVMG